MCVNTIAPIGCIIPTHMWMKDAMNIVSLFLICLRVYPSSQLHCLINNTCVRVFLEPDLDMVCVVWLRPWRSSRAAILNVPKNVAQPNDCGTM